MKKAIKKYKRKQKSVKEGEKDDRRKKSKSDLRIIEAEFLETLTE